MKRPPYSLKPHEQLLASCATSYVTERTVRTIDALLSGPPIDWPSFVAASVRHGVAQCAAFHLRAREGDIRIPFSVRIALDRMYRANARRNDVLFREAGGLLRAFDDAGLRSLALKGVALARTVYPTAAVRNFADLDILVEASCFEDAARIVEACGFAPEGGREPLAHDQTFVLRCREDILTDTVAPEFDPSITPEILVQCRHRVVLELHRGLFRDASGLWRQADLAPFYGGPQTADLPDGTRFRLPAPEAMLVHLCAHAADHGFCRLMYPMDIAETVRKHVSTLSWERVLALAEQFEVSRSVYRGLELAAREFDAPVPPTVLRQLLSGSSPAPPVELADIFQANQAGRSETTLRRWLDAESHGERAMAVLRLLAPPPANIRRIYGVRHPLLVALVYVVRPIQLAGRLIRVLCSGPSRGAEREIR